MQFIRLSESLQLWPWIMLRAAGFPSENVLQLAAKTSAEAIERLSCLEDDFNKALQTAICALEPALERRSGKERKPFSKAMAKLRKGRLPQNLASLEEAEPALLRARQRLDELEEQQRCFEIAFADDEDRTYKHLIEAATEPRFREAVAWQNVGALRTGIDKLVGSSAGKYQRLVANYLQRYCTKNDQIGFFGPIGWGHVVDKNPKITPGNQLLSKRSVYFDFWAIDLLACQLAEAPSLKKCLRPRRHPTVAIDGSTLRYGVDGETEVPGAIAWLLSNADGSKTASALAAEACDLGEVELDDLDDVFEILEELEERGLLLWQVEIPTISRHPEEYLRSTLKEAGEGGEAGLAILEQLDERRLALSEAAGDAEACAEALERLNTTYQELTGQSASRNAGATYGARTPVYEDCVRDIELRLPSAVLKTVGPALSLVLKSATWCSADVGKKYRATFEEAYCELGEGSVRYAAFYNRIVDSMPTMIGEGGGMVAESLTELAKRWTDVLQLDTTKSEQRFTTAELRTKVETMFENDGPGWPGARFHCPDLLIASSEDPAQCLAEDLQIVLGEIHATTFSVFSLCGADGWPDLPQVVAAYENESPTHIETVIPKPSAGRASGHSMSARDIHLEIGSAYSMRSRDQVVSASQLFVERDGEELVVRTKDGKHSFDIVAFFEYNLGHAIGSRFGIMPSASHTPRIVIDTLVVARETWRFDSTDLDFATASRGANQFASINRWRRSIGLPRWVFAKASSERKPTYVDFDSPIILEILCNQIRKSERVTFSEMLPALDQCWLQDAEGQRYVSEFRTVVVDDTPWRGGSSRATTR